MTLINNGTANDRLVSVSTPVAGVAQLHTTTTENGVMGMRPLAALDVKPGAPTVLKPGGYHVMLMDLKGPLVVGQSFAVSVTFEKAGRIDVTAVVEKAGAMSSGRHARNENVSSERRARRRSISAGHDRRSVLILLRTIRLP